jgi:hypothetical protein
MYVDVKSSITRPTVMNALLVNFVLALGLRGDRGAVTFSCVFTAPSVAFEARFAAESEPRFNHRL